MAATESFTWQWCDLTGSAAGDAREINWHPYAPDHSDELEDAWVRSAEKEICIGLTSYKIGEWQGAYGTQKNLTTGVVRQVRRGRFSVQAATPTDYLDDSCALCTEKFTDTPEWPIRRTPCNHAFHYTCLQHILRQRAGAPRCPMCRRSIASMSSGRGGGGGGTQAEVERPHPADQSASYLMPPPGRYMTQQDIPGWEPQRWR